MFDLHNNVAVAHLLDAQDITADTYSNYVDLAGYEGAEFLVNFGAATPLSGSAYMTPKLYEASVTPTATGSYSAVAAGDLLGSFTAIDAQSEDQTTQRVGYRGSKRYVCVLLDETGSLTSCLVSVDAVLGIPRDAPAAAPTTGTVT